MRSYHGEALRGSAPGERETRGAEGPDRAVVRDGGRKHGPRGRIRTDGVTLLVRGDPREGHGDVEGGRHRNLYELRFADPLAADGECERLVGPGSWLMVYGLWFMVHGVWFVDLWFGLRVYGLADQAAEMQMGL